MPRDDEEMGGHSRRFFLKTMGVTAGLYWFGPRLMLNGEVLAALPGGTLDPNSIPKFAAPLIIPPAMPRDGVISLKGKAADYYEIAVQQFSQQILPSSLPPTTVWSYASAADPGTRNYPAFTIEAHKGRPVVVKWINDLVDAQGRFLPHLLPVDPTLHWANPPGGTQHRDTRPDFTGQPTPGRYTGPVPIVTHVHGMRGVGDESDGYPEAWFLPNAIDIPAEYAAEGTWYNFFRSKAQAKGVTWSKGSATFIYPNQQRASTVVVS